MYIQYNSWEAPSYRNIYAVLLFLIEFSATSAKPFGVLLLPNSPKVLRLEAWKVITPPCSGVNFANQERCAANRDAP
jgi:hypothetical protein